ncbi:hotdog fold thioesterase [Pseudarthrobacter sp. J1738]|uniref:hotdog fold thioesterase n=1 Tax=Pseudarthrobacter sp. J1738 TaxID=3420446 RepID=UPI003D2E2870
MSATTHSILENDHASAWLGLEVLKLGPGHATTRMTLRKEMLNGFGIAHGGMIFAFADSTFALACNPAVGSEHSITVASGVDINFIKPAHEGQVITAIADRRAHAGRSGIYDIQLFAADPSKVTNGSASSGTATTDGGTPHSGTGTNTSGEPYGELIAEFRGRSRTISKK